MNRKPQKRRYRVFTDKYYSIYKPYHPYSDKNGRIREHRYIMHIYLSIKYNRIIYLPKSYEVHHINEDTYDNRIENLQLISKKNHRIHHLRDINRLCNLCHKYNIKWYDDIDGYLCYNCYVLIRRLKKKFGI